MCAMISNRIMAARRKKLLSPAKIFIGSVLILIAATLGTWLLIRGIDMPVLNPQGVIAAQEKDLIIFTLLLSVVVVVPVFVMLGLFAWRYREGNHKAEYRPDEDGNTWLELLWWGIPILIIGILGTVTWITTHQLDPHKTINNGAAPVRVQVVALQWKWLFLYPDQHIASLNELRIPANTPVNFEITADAPMSAFWVPSLGSQIYAMSGMSSKLSLMADKAGTYRGANSNINGKGYADMHFNVIALASRQDFNDWVSGIADAESHKHLDSGVYEELAKPSEKNPVTYYHLHDTDLYTKILNKYMASGTGGAAMHDDEHTHGGTE